MILGTDFMLLNSTQWNPIVSLHQLWAIMFGLNLGNCLDESFQWCGVVNTKSAAVSGHTYVEKFDQLSDVFLPALIC